MTTAAAAPADAPPRPLPGPVDRVTAAHLWVSLAFLVVGLVVLLVTALQLVWPDTLGGVAVLSFGRLTPAAWNALAWGFAAVGLYGAGYHVVGRSTGMPVFGGSLPLAALGLTVLGLAAGLAAVLLGAMEGRQLGELPLWADAAVAAGLLGSAFAATRTADPASERATPPAVWFALGGMWWVALAFVVINMPGLAGVSVAIQTSFGLGALLLGGFPALGLAVAYHFASSLQPVAAQADEDGADAAQADEDGAGDADQLARIGFWSLLFVAGWVGPAFLVHSPAPGWLVTVGVAFTILYLVPVLALVTDLLRRVGGLWPAVAGRAGTRFLATGVALYVLLALGVVVMGLRASGSIVGLTPWFDGLLVLAVLGVAGAWLLGFVHLVMPVSHSWARLHFGLTLGGLAVVVASLWAAGIHTGYTWVGTANGGELVDAGLGFRNSIEPMAAWFEWRAAGLAVVVAAQLLLAAALATRSRAVEPLPAAPPVDPPAADPAGAAAPLPLRLAIQGALGLFLVGVLAMVVVPSLEQPSRTATILGELRDFPAGSPEAAGREIYIQEGCVYCHTQMVRPVITDVGLGAVSQPGDYAELGTPLLGNRRLGPDLMHAGAREPTDSVRWVRDHLVDPYRDRPWSVMPSYDYLSAEDLQALAQYIAALD